MPLETGHPGAESHLGFQEREGPLGVESRPLRRGGGEGGQIASLSGAPEEEDKDEEKDEAAADVSAKAPEPVEPAPAKSKKGSAGRKKGEPFSETKWFMVGETVKEQEVEAEDRPLDDLQDVYKQTRTLPPDVRKKFSLKYGAKDDDKGSGKKKKS